MKSTAKTPRNGLASQVKRLQKELAEVKRERDCFLHEVYKQMQRESEEMDLDFDDLRSLIGKGVSSDDLLKKLAGKLKARST